MIFKNVGCSCQNIMNTQASVTKSGLQATQIRLVLTVSFRKKSAEMDRRFAFSSTKTHDVDRFCVFFCFFQIFVYGGEGSKPCDFKENPKMGLPVIQSSGQVCTIGGLVVRFSTVPGRLVCPLIVTLKASKAERQQQSGKSRDLFGFP